MTTTAASPSEPLPCPGCSRPPVVHSAYSRLYSVTCGNCYGPVKDSGRVEKLAGWSFTSQADAICDWNDHVTDYAEAADDAVR